MLFFFLTDLRKDVIGCTIDNALYFLKIIGQFGSTMNLDVKDLINADKSQLEARLEWKNMAYSREEIEALIREISEFSGEIDWDGSGLVQVEDIKEIIRTVQKELDVSADMLASAVNIASRTLTRRKKKGRFEPDESERVLRIASLFDRALRVLHRHRRVQQWFKSPQKGLGGKAPLEYADTEPGAREVEDLLGRLEHGVFS
jgi:putative toxin-antitoxin system antitoxin component (TIGR02293 family)